MKRSLVRIVKRLTDKPEIPKASLTGSLIGYAKHLSGPPKGRALLSYLPTPVCDELANKPETEFSNRGIARILPRALNELGYVVDIVSWDDNSFSTNNTYDLLVQHGGINYDRLAKLVKPSGTVIYFSSGSYWKYHNSQERARFKAFEERHNGARLPYDRLIVNSEEKVNREADAIIALGNQEVRKTYQDFPRVYSLDLACYPDKRPVIKNFSVVKNNFLFFAGGGGIHKGLDLTIEAFLKLSQHLYIMAYIEPAVLDFYKEAFNAPNIHLIGPGNFRSPEFYQVMDKCGFAILPSCSEGQPGSIVESMNEGLIPIVGKDVHINVDDFGYFLQPANILKIRQVVELAANLKKADLSERSKKARVTAIKKHSPDVFLEKLKNYISETIHTESGVSE